MDDAGQVEAGNVLDALLDRVERGEDVVITRQGKPVARLVGRRPALIGNGPGRPPNAFANGQRE